MRLWHYKLIPVLPDKQLKAMRYEIGDMIKQHPNIKNGLVKYANNYDIMFLGSYFARVCLECERRKINCSKDYNSKIFNLICGRSNSVYYNYNFSEHNDRYLKQCYYNLQEKYDRGIITKEEWEKIEGVLNV